MSIIPKKVYMTELFYDLIYVFAVQQTTHMIHHLHNGIIDPLNYLKFAIVCMILLLMWFNQTVYLNKFGTNSWYDIIGLFLHMFGAVYVANNITTDWNTAFIPFNAAAIGMSLVVLIQYLLRMREFDEIPFDITMQIQIITFQIVGLFIALILGENYGLVIASIVYVAALFAPIFFKKNNHEIATNFPHLVERISLIMIIVFGETIVGLAGISTNLGIIQISSFASVCCLFLFYTLQIEAFIDHHQTTKGQILMYSSIGSFIGICSLTVSFHLMTQSDVNWTFLILFRSASFALCIATFLMNHVYYHDHYRLASADWCVYISIIALFTLLNFLLAVHNVFIFSILFLIATSATLGYGIFRYKTNQAS